MADRVQFIMDRMAVTFREMEDFGVFSQEEVKSVVKKRTDFEYRLRRRQQTPADYYGYLEYEINLEKLRAMRCHNQSQDARESGDKAVSKEVINRHRKLQAAFMKHISYVFERGLRRFPDNMELWKYYISFLKDKKAHSILNTVFGRALSLHPKNESLWLQAAVFEIDENSNAHAARVLLQRSLRVIKHSEKLWQTYFELELWYIARGDERRRVLGIQESKAQNSSDDNLGVPWVVYRHATKEIPSLSFAVSLLKATGKGFATNQEECDPLQREIQNDISNRFKNDKAYWTSIIQLTVDTGVDQIYAKQRHVNKLFKSTKSGRKRTSSELENGQDSDTSKDKINASLQKNLLVFKLETTCSVILDTLSILQSCKNCGDELKFVDSNFVACCICGIFSSLSHVLYNPASERVRLSAVDLFQTQKDVDHPNVLQRLSSALDACVDELSLNDKDETSRMNNPFELACWTEVNYLQSMISNEYPAYKSSGDLDLDRCFQNLLVWLKQNAPESGILGVWAFLSKKALRLLSLKYFTENCSCDFQIEMAQVADMVLSRAPLLLCRPSNDCEDLSSNFPSLYQELNDIKMRSSIIWKAIEVKMCSESEASNFSSLAAAVQSALLEWKPPSSNDSSYNLVCELYVEWLQRYEQLVLHYEGEREWRKACEFVEDRCLAARPHCMAAVDLESYYSDVISSAVSLLRNSKFDASGGGDAGELDKFSRKVVRNALKRCSSEEAQSRFLDSLEQIDRLAGRTSEANHTRWKKMRGVC